MSFSPECRCEPFITLELIAEQYKGCNEDGVILAGKAIDIEKIHYHLTMAVLDAIAKGHSQVHVHIGLFTPKDPLPPTIRRITLKKAL